jgi:phosphoribosyl 1,2-cyclic phosphodiesterase
MKSLGEDPQSLSAILITHEHSDHIYGLATLAKKLRIPVFMTGATHAAWARAMRTVNGERPQLERLERFESGHRFQIGDIEVKPFTIPHDAADPVGFSFRAEGVKISIATDLGYMPDSIRFHLRSSDALLLESNHDVEMLKVGPYPWALKQRIMGRNGHLSNDVACNFIRDELDTRTSTLILGHLSAQNNHPEIVRLMAEQALDGRNLFTRLVIAETKRPLDQPCESFVY